MKKLTLALIAALLLSAAPRSWAAGANVTVATTAGGTTVSPVNTSAHYLQLTNTGTANVADCVVVGEGTVSSTVWNFQLQPNGGTWIAPMISYEPNILNGPRVVGAAEGIKCIAISSSTTVHWSMR